MVAAWMSADTGVGPSIASRSQACSGTWADLPHAPSSRSSPSAVATDSLACPATVAFTTWIDDVPSCANISMIASAMPTSPTRLSTNAFLAAAAADGLCCQNPMSRYDASPTPSQPRNSTR
jgi:hypothetical protein